MVGDESDVGASDRTTGTEPAQLMDWRDCVVLLLFSCALMLMTVSMSIP
jgi:hypothetical protein